MFSKSYLLLAVLFFISTGCLAKGIVVINKNTEFELSRNEIQSLFLFKNRRLPNGDICEPLLSDNDEINKLFIRNVLNKSYSQYRGYFAKLVFTGRGRPPKIYNEKEVITKLLNKQNVIGVISSENVDTADFKILLTF